MINFQEVTIQTFDDQKRKNKGYLSRIFLFDRKKIVELNSKGAGITFTPNPQLDPCKRSIENTKALKYISLDLDAAKEEESLSQIEISNRKQELLTKIKLLAIKPNYIIETKHGYQPLWELAETIVLNNTKDRQEMNKRYKAVVAGFTVVTELQSEGDNIARTIRVADTNHLKDPSNPFRIKLIECGTKKVTLQEFEKVYPPVKAIEPINDKYRVQSADPAIKKILDYPIKDALMALSGQKAVDSEVFDFKHNGNGTLQLIINGRLTAQWIDLKNNTIGGPGNGQGNPTIIQFVQWYGTHRRGEDQKTAKENAIKALMRVLKISDNNSLLDRKKSQPTSRNNDTNNNPNINGGCKLGPNFELTKSKLEIILKLRKCTWLTPPLVVSGLLEELFKEWPSKPGHWLYTARHKTPRMICWTLNEIEKDCRLGRRTLNNPAGYFTFLIRKRKLRKS